MKTRRRATRPILAVAFVAPFAPVTSFLSLYLVAALPFMEEFTLGAWLLVLAQFVLMCGLVVLAVTWRKSPVRLVAVVGVYALTAVGLAAAGLSR